MRALSLASRFDSGSSNRNVPASRTIARPIATRWRWPPDSSAGFLFSSSVMFRIRATSRTRVSICFFGVRARRSANDMFRAMFMCGYSA